MAPNHRQNLMQEQKELKARCEEMQKYIYRNPVFKKLHPSEQKRLEKQYQIMLRYDSILYERINDSIQDDWTV